MKAQEQDKIFRVDESVIPNPLAAVIKIDYTDREGLIDSIKEALNRIEDGNTSGQEEACGMAFEFFTDLDNT